MCIRDRGNDVTSSCSVGATHVSCDVSGLVNGSYTVTVTVGDKNQPPLTATGSSTFNVVLCNVKPALSVTTGSPYWASYMNYMLGILSVHYNIHNDGPDAKQVTIQGIVPTNGVILRSYTPNVGDIATGGDGGFMARYSVPYVVHFFRTTIYASAMDECNNSYSYPGPYPGS